MKRILLLVFSITILSSCMNQVDHYVLKVKLNKLTEENMYDRQLVDDILFDAEELNKDSLQTAAHEHFLKGIDLIKNKNKRSEGIAALKRSILLFPDAKCYYELGNALAEAGNKYQLE